MVKKLGKREDIVIATGGGAVLLSENLAALKENSILIGLDARPEDIYARVNRKKGTRPLLKKNISIQEIETLLQARNPYYACADIRIDTSGKKLNLIIKEILQEIRNKNLQE